MDAIRRNIQGGVGGILLNGLNLVRRANEGEGEGGRPRRARPRRAPRPPRERRRWPRAPIPGGNDVRLMLALRRARMRPIRLHRAVIRPDGTTTYYFRCDCCHTEIKSPFKWGGSRKTSHADSMNHQRKFETYCRLHDIEYDPIPPQPARAQPRPQNVNGANQNQ